ncbi:MAG: hypothetical protein WD572_09930 [Gammaproteobacteria bacterium]
MFSAFKNAYYFSKVSLAAIDAFGIDLKKFDGIGNIDIIECCNKARADGKSVEEGVVLCLATCSSAIAKDANFHPEDRPDYFKLGRQAVIVDGWVAQGKVSPESRDIFIEAVLEAMNAVESAGHDT